MDLAETVKRGVCAVVLAAAALELGASEAAAADSRYREYVVGDRAGGMGGAAIAIARDVDAIYANPAGMAASEGNSISLSANLYGLEYYRLGNGLSYGDDASGSTFVSIPGAIGGVVRLSDDWTGGFGVFTPKQEERHIVSSRGGGARSYHYSYNDKTMWIGPAVSWQPRDADFRLGAGIFAVYRNLGAAMSYYIRDSQTINGACDLKTFGALAMAGAQWDPGNGWHLGLTFQTPTWNIYDDGRLSLNGLDVASGLSVDRFSKDVDADNHVPLQLGLGIAKDLSDCWVVAFDALWHPSAHYEFMRWKGADSGLTQGVSLDSVLDVSLGTEFVVAEHYPIRFGVYTAFSGVELPSDPEGLERRGSDIDTSDVDMYGVTFSVGRRQEHVSVNLGIDYAFGQGHDIGYDSDDEYMRSSCKNHVLLCTLSTTYHF